MSKLDIIESIRNLVIAIGLILFGIDIADYYHLNQIRTTSSLFSLTVVAAAFLTIYLYRQRAKTNQTKTAKQQNG